MSEEVEHVTLVAIVTTGADVQQAQRALVAGMPQIGADSTRTDWDSWWVADDSLGFSGHGTRVVDGSDNDPAVFCHPMMQERASRALWYLNLTPEHNTKRLNRAEERTEILQAVRTLLATHERLCREDESFWTEGEV